MNFYGLPEFLSYSFLVGIACVLLKNDENPSLRFWLIGWIVVLIHAGIFMLFPFSFPFDLIGRGTLIVAGQCFIIAAIYHSKQGKRDPLILGVFLIWCISNLLFQIYAARYSNITSLNTAEQVLYALTAICTILASTTAIIARSNATILLALIVFTYSIQFVLLQYYGALMASQWQMGVTYFAVSYFFLRKNSKLTMGVYLTALTFALWGLVFPTYAFIKIYDKNILKNIESAIWNLPKFLSAACMVLILLEDKIAQATY